MNKIHPIFAFVLNPDGVFERSPKTNKRDVFLLIMTFLNEIHSIFALALNPDRILK